MSAISDGEKFIAQMVDKIRIEYQCDASDIDVGGLRLETTWESGQDFSAPYDVDYDDGRHYEGRIFWSSVSQEVHF